MFRSTTSAGAVSFPVSRGTRRKAQAAAGVAHDAAGDGAVGPASPELPLAGATMAEPPAFSRAEARRRWTELLRLIYEVDPLVCPACGGEMRVIALTQEPAVIDKILRHLRDQGRDARAGPWATGPPERATAAEAA